ncbi:MAG TPA: hypothetical protein VGM42_08595, partial [Rhodopila sp.]
ALHEAEFATVAQAFELEDEIAVGQWCFGQDVNPIVRSGGAWGLINGRGDFPQRTLSVNADGL